MIYIYWYWIDWLWINAKNFWVNYNIFSWLDLEKSNFENSSFEECFTENFGEYLNISFQWTNLKEANFKNTNLLEWADFRWAYLKWADFRWAKFKTDTFSDEQLDDMILTDEDYKKYQEKKKLEEENKKLKKDVKKKENTIKNTSEKQINKLTESFEKLEHNFWVEEKRWLLISFIIFVCLLFFLSIPIFDIFMYSYTYKIIFWWIIVIIWLIVSVTTMIASIDIPEEKKWKWIFKEIWSFASDTVVLLPTWTKYFWP